jgi:hypothetical protein
MTILVVGGDSAETFRQRAAQRHGQVAHWSGRKTRDVGKSIPKNTAAVVVILDRVSHSLARKVRSEATHRGLPVFFQRRGRRIDSTDGDPTDLMQWLDARNLPARRTIPHDKTSAEQLQ